MYVDIRPVMSIYQIDIHGKLSGQVHINTIEDLNPFSELIVSSITMLPYPKTSIKAQYLSSMLEFINLFNSIVLSG